MAPRACLVVKDRSVRYIRNVLAALHETLKEVFGPDTPMIACEEVEDADHEDGSLVFVVGERFSPFRRRPGCRYVGINFSVITLLGWPFATSQEGKRFISDRRRMVREKLHLFDAFLDYYPAQTRKLKAAFDIPVFGFLPWVPPQVDTALPNLSGRIYDVCFVGIDTPRRLAMREQLVARGLEVSPPTSSDVESVAARSRCTLNIHQERSNFFEIPRVIGAMSVGSPVITERCWGSRAVIPDTLLTIGSRRNLADLVEASLADLAALENRARWAEAWYRTEYVPRARRMFVDAVQQIAQVVPAR